MPVFKRINYNNAIFTYKASNNLTPAYISDLLTPTAIAYNRNLRSLKVPKPRTSFYTSLFTVSAPKSWDTFTISVNQAASLNTLQISMIEHISF